VRALVFEVFSLIGVGDIVTVGLGDEAIFALLFVRFVGSATQPIASMQPAKTRADPKYGFILCFLPFVFLRALFGKVCAAAPPTLCVFRSSLRLRAKHKRSTDFVQPEKQAVWLMTARSGTLDRRSIPALNDKRTVI
jgi:hypothetical protein